MTVANHTFDIAWIEGRGRDSRLPTGLPSMDGTALALKAESITPGRLVTMTSISIGSFDTWANFRRWRSDGNNLPADDQTWGGKGAWDRVRKLAFYLGDRTANTMPDKYNLKIYRASSDEWYHGSHITPEGSARIGQPHTYGNQCIDDAGGWFFYGAEDTRLCRYVIDEDRWETPAVAGISSLSVPSTGGQDYHEGLGLILAMENRLSNSRLVGLDPRTLAWQSLGASGHDGHHCHSKYNRKRGDMLFLHGNNAQRRVTLVAADGTFQRMADVPSVVDGETLPVGTGNFHLTYDPITGNYLWVCVADVRRIFEYNPDEDEWKLATDFSSGSPIASDWPGPYYGHLGIPIDELGVLLWVTSYPPRIYKHVSAFGGA